MPASVFTVFDEEAISTDATGQRLCQAFNDVMADAIVRYPKG